MIPERLTIPCFQIDRAGVWGAMTGWSARCRTHLPLQALEIPDSGYLPNTPKFEEPIVPDQIFPPWPSPMVSSSLVMQPVAHSICNKTIMVICQNLLWEDRSTLQDCWSKCSEKNLPMSKFLSLWYPVKTDLSYASHAIVRHFPFLTCLICEALTKMMSGKQGVEYTPILISNVPCRAHSN